MVEREKLGDNVFNGEREEIMVEKGNQWQEKKIEKREGGRGEERK